MKKHAIKNGPRLFFLRNTQDHVDEQDRKAVSYKERKVHVPVVYHAGAEEHPDILKTKPEKGNDYYQSHVVVN